MQSAAVPAYAVLQPDPSHAALQSAQALSAAVLRSAAAPADTALQSAQSLSAAVLRSAAAPADTALQPAQALSAAPSCGSLLSLQ